MARRIYTNKGICIYCCKRAPEVAFDTNLSSYEHAEKLNHQTHSTSGAMSKVVLFFLYFNRRLRQEKVVHIYFCYNMVVVHSVFYSNVEKSISGASVTFPVRSNQVSVFKFSSKNPPIER